MGDKKAGIILNTGLVSALIFSYYIAYNEIVVFLELL